MGLTYHSSRTDAHLGQHRSGLVPSQEVNPTSNHSVIDDLIKDLFEDAETGTLAAVGLRLFVGVFGNLVLEERGRRRERVERDLAVPSATITVNKRNPHAKLFPYSQNIRLETANGPSCAHNEFTIIDGRVIEGMLEGVQHGLDEVCPGLED